ncbi:hypothetical protein [Tropicibacter sp. S64]|uniref:hypothetical protein n=1 Tax=Tropicibacter sp. S64 TaxID=3415122 RepID=UPI003C7B427C
MIETRADVVLMAHVLGRDMTDLERIALGATLIQTVLTPANHCAVRLAAARINEHADALMDALIEMNTGAGPHPGKATTHEQSGPLRIPEAPPSGPSTPCAMETSPWWRTAWASFRIVEARLSNSLAGDLLGGLCIWVISMALFVFAPLFLTL